MGFEADGAGLERDVDILCHEDGRGLAGVAHIERGGDDPVVFFPEVRQNGAEGLHRGQVALGRVGDVGVDDDGKRASAGEFDALVHRAGVREKLREDAVHPAGIAASLGGLLRFYGVEFLQNFDWYRQVVILELEDRLGVVEEDVGV